MELDENQKLVVNCNEINHFNLINKIDYILKNQEYLKNNMANKNKSILKLLLDNGADPNIANDYGKKPFDYYLFFNKQDKEYCFQEIKQKNVSYQF